MTNEEARAIMTALKQSYINFRTKSDLKKKTVKENIEAYDMSIKALEQECVDLTHKHVGNALDMRCDDAISRQAVLKCFTWTNDKADVWNRIKELPPINPQEPKTDVLDKIRAEIETKYGQCDICEYFEDFDYEENDISEYRAVGNISDILQIIDKYRVESEVSDADSD